MDRTMNAAGKTITMIVAIAVALVAVATASAHYGDTWFQTRSAMEPNIESKYLIDSAICRPAPNGHWQKDNEWSIKRWDHFVCGVWSSISDRACVVLAHQTGGQWHNISC